MSDLIRGINAPFAYRGGVICMSSGAPNNQWLADQSPVFLFVENTVELIALLFHSIKTRLQWGHMMVHLYMISNTLYM